MEMKFAKMLIQLFAEEELETTDSQEDEELENFTDDQDESSNEVEKETTEEPEKVKTFTQEEVDEMIKSRIKRERNRIEREHNEEVNKYRELAFLTGKGLNAENLEETLKKSRQFYEGKGIKYIPEENTREDEIIANAFSKDIIDDCETIEDLENEVNKLNKKADASNRDKLVLNNLVNELNNKKRIAELKK